jgi:hypothetical protein
MRLCGALAAASVVILPATAEATTPTTAVTAQQTRAEVRVGDFLGDYRQAVLHKSGQTPEQVRAHYLTADLNKRLDAWSSAHDADPVFQAQNVPASWILRYEGSGAGHSTVVVTEHWKGGHDQGVWYAVRLADVVISDLKEPPAA